MEQLKIFESEEFGSIRTVMRDGEVCSWEKMWLRR